MARPPVSPLRVRLAGAYKFDQLDRLIRDLAPLTDLRRRRVVEVDLRGLVAVGPSALALLTAVLMRASHNGRFARGSELIMPASPQVRNYLTRMDLVRLIAPSAPDPGIARHPPVGFRPCREFVTADECREVARELTDALAERCETERIARASIRICLDELAENVVHRADAPLGGFAAAQGWMRTQQFEIAIVDLGVGIRNSLAKNPAYADIEDDVTAINTALQPYVSSTPDRNSGIGLFITRLLLRENGGTLVVRSGLGAVYSGAEEREHEAEIGFPGTLVAVRARIDRPLDINEVYRRLEIRDDGDNAGADDPSR